MSCEDGFEGDKADNGIEHLEFKVDGRQFESASIPSQCNALNFNYFPEPHLDLPPGYMTMWASNCVDSTSLSLTFQRVTSEYTGSSSFESLDFAESFTPVFRAGNSTIYNRLLDGSITIDQFTGVKKNASGRLTGTFEIRLIDSEKTDTLTITEGKFNFFISQKLH
jgi:hypothetical protein